MFSIMSVCDYVHTWAYCDHYSWCIGPHYTGTPYPIFPLDMGPQCTGTPVLPPEHMTALCRDQLLVICGGQEWRPVQTFSLEAPNQYWHLVVTEECMVGKGTVCFLIWNAFLRVSWSCFDIHDIWWYGWKGLGLSFPKLLKISWILRKLGANICVYNIIFWPIRHSIKCIYIVYIT